MCLSNRAPSCGGASMQIPPLPLPITTTIYRTPIKHKIWQEKKKGNWDWWDVRVVATLQSPYTPHSAWTGQVFFVNEPYPTSTTSCNEDGRNGSKSSSSSNNAQTTTTTTTSIKYQWQTPIPRSRTCSSISTSSSNSIPSATDAVCRLRIQ